MSISRRAFLLSTVGAAGGFILHFFYYRALQFMEQFEQPLLEPPAVVTQELNILDVAGEYLELNLGDPFAEPPTGLTFRQFFERYQPDGFDTFKEDWELPLTALDSPVPRYYVEDSWSLRDGPHAKAYRLLKSLDLGPDLTGPSAAGGLSFILGPFPGSNYMAAHIDDYLSASLLQQRLNDLGMDIRVQLGGAV